MIKLLCLLFGHKWVRVDEYSSRFIKNPHRYTQCKRCGIKQ